MAIYKNTAGQKIAVFAYTAATGAAKTGDAANITAYLSKDGAAPAAITDTNPAELDATNMPGWYVFDLTQAETDAELLIIAPLSATSGVLLDQLQLFTTTAPTIPTVAAIADAVWDEPMLGHSSAGSAGQNLLFGISVPDDIADAVWDEARAGHTTAGTYGNTAEWAAGGAIPSAADIADAVWDETLTGASHNLPTSAGRRLRQLGDTIAGSVDDASPTAATFDTDLTGYADDHFNDQLVRFTSGDLTGQTKPILSFNAANGTITVDEGFTEAPANGDMFDILPFHVHPISQIQDGLATPADLAGLPTNAELAAALAAADDATLAAIAGLTIPTASAIAGQVWDEDLAAHSSAGTAGKALQDAVGGSSGVGAITFVYTLTSSVDSTPIEDADVWVTSNSDGTGLLASGRTNASGEVTFYLDAGTVYVWRQKKGWNFTNPDTETVS